MLRLSAVARNRVAGIGNAEFLLHRKADERPGGALTDRQSTASLTSPNSRASSDAQRRLDVLSIPSDYDKLDEDICTEPPLQRTWLIATPSDQDASCDRRRCFVIGGAIS